MVFVKLLAEKRVLIAAPRGGYHGMPLSARRRYVSLIGAHGARCCRLDTSRFGACFSRLRQEDSKCHDPAKALYLASPAHAHISHTRDGLVVLRALQQYVIGAEVPDRRHIIAVSRRYSRGSGRLSTAARSKAFGLGTVLR